jgi:hypothetical protein
MYSASLQQDAIAETYADLRLLVYQLTHRFARRYHIEFEDLISESHVIFVKACQRYDPTGGMSISSWVYSKLWWGLIDHMKREMRHHLAHRHENIDDHQHIESGREAPDFLIGVRNELNFDASAIISLIVNANNDLAIVCKWNNVRRKGGFKKAIKEHLYDMGWTREEVKQSFKDIAAVISDRNAERPKPVKVFDIDRVRMTKEDWWLHRNIGLTAERVRELLA